MAMVGRGAAAGGAGGGGVVRVAAAAAGDDFYARYMQALQCVVKNHANMLQKSILPEVQNILPELDAAITDQKHLGKVTTEQKLLGLLKIRINNLLKENEDIDERRQNDTIRKGTQETGFYWVGKGGERYMRRFVRSTPLQLWIIKYALEQAKKPLEKSLLDNMNLKGAALSPQDKKDIETLGKACYGEGFISPFSMEITTRMVM